MKRDENMAREYVKKGESVCDSGYRMTMQILENRRRPDALVCADNYIAYGCVNALHDRGILIPEEMKVILEAKNRDMAGRIAPPEGLFLLHVAYEGERKTV